MSGGRRLDVSLSREMELWQRPPITAIRVLKFCRTRSFYRRMEKRSRQGIFETPNKTINPSELSSAGLPELRGWTWWRPAPAAGPCVCWGSSAAPTGTLRYTSWLSVPEQGCPALTPAPRSCGSPGTGQTTDQTTAIRTFNRQTPK